MVLQSVGVGTKVGRAVGSTHHHDGVIAVDRSSTKVADTMILWFIIAAVVLIVGAVAWSRSDLRSLRRGERD
jgi:hypothetical protein